MIFRFLLPLFALSLAAAESTFCIIVPSHNNGQWYQQNLDSIFDQQHPDYRVIYIDDASTDGTADLVANYVKEKGEENRFILLRNLERQGPLACMCQAIALCDKQEIIVDLNGDDWLAHDEVLHDLSEVYSDPNVWMTYGQFVKYPTYKLGFAHSVPQEVIEKNTFRSCGGAVTHLKTFYAALFQEINREDFFFEGEFIRRAGDLAYTIPILEMAGDHSRFLPDILYVYNYTYPMHVDKIPNAFETQMDCYIRSKTPYLPLEELPTQKTLPIYTQMSNMTAPTLQDYRFVQDYLSFGKRDQIEGFGYITSRMRNFKIIGSMPNEYPLSGKISVNCDEGEAENSILIYSSFNGQYPEKLEQLVGLIKASDFKGDILYRLGGWPNEEAGDIALAHIPYGFKASFFQEAKNKGYKKALWLDVAVIPIVSLNQIFEIIDEKGYFVINCTHSVGPYSSPTSNSYFGINHSSTFQIPSCLSGLIGIDFTKPIGKTIASWWYKAAWDKDAYFNARPDQSVLSIILHQLGIYDFLPIRNLPHSPDEIQPDSLFLLDRYFVH